MLRGWGVFFFPPLCLFFAAFSPLLFAAPLTHDDQRKFAEYYANLRLWEHARVFSERLISEKGADSSDIARHAYILWELEDKNPNLVFTFLKERQSAVGTFEHWLAMWTAYRKSFRRKESLRLMGVLRNQKEKEKFDCSIVSQALVAFPAEDRWNRDFRFQRLRYLRACQARSQLWNQLSEDLLDDPFWLEARKFFRFFEAKPGADRLFTRLKRDILEKWSNVPDQHLILQN